MRDKNYYQRRAREIIDEIKYLTLSTVSNKGIPWNSPVWYARDEKYNFYFGSPKNTQHSKNIRSNGRGFVVIYDSRALEGTGEGVYMTVTVKELNRLSAINRAIKVMYKSGSNKRSTSDFLGGAPLRIYHVKPKRVWMNDAEERNGTYLDYRVLIRLE